MTIARGPIFQLCWVVTDLAAATREFGERYGVDRWTTFPDVRFGPDRCELRGAPADYTISVALGYAGGQQLELIEPRSGVSLYSEHGPGLHHVGWIPEDFDAAVAEAGPDIVARGASEGMEFVYLAGGPLGSYVELMRLSEPMRALFDQLVPDGYRNPWT
ncbi:VOC family protein [Nocardia sp. NPDC127579]|uniref:VOC family protein n=1 Tax=Nocardia sp. NPDC127579 TaxID=3345402 RepID=UPI00362D58D6